ncbi:MAG: dihydroorotate dehydrogenase electron transfer subunit [PVC group bacterium]|nr:dihydroorotate dehydrogenase electron transfer subunit [PVC group bacterium]
MIYDVKATIVSNTKIAHDVYRLEMDVPKLATKLRPGQFMHLRVGTGIDPLLRRPFSTYRIIKKRGNKRDLVGIIYRVVGKGTDLLTQKCRGEQIDVLGALGNGFDISPKFLKKSQIILVGGGIGVVPLVYLAETLKKKSKAEVIAFIGAATKQDIVCIKDLKEHGCKVNISTDDGTQGYKGYVSDMLEQYLSDTQCFENPYIYACGPFPMLKALSMLACKFGLDGQVSVDEMMGCGIGACLGCVIKTKNLSDNTSGYKRICKDGPVFDINEIVWED